MKISPAFVAATIAASPFVRGAPLVSSSALVKRSGSFDAVQPGRLVLFRREDSIADASSEKQTPSSPEDGALEVRGILQWLGKASDEDLSLVPLPHRWTRIDNAKDWSYNKDIMKGHENDYKEVKIYLPNDSRISLKQSIQRQKQVLASSPHAKAGRKQYKIDHSPSKSRWVHRDELDDGVKMSREGLRDKLRDMLPWTRS